MVEDDKDHRHDFKEYISVLSQALGYPINFYMAEGESDGLSLVQKFDFDAIILDLELEASDGDGITFLKKLKQLNLPVKPYIVVVSFNRSPLSKETARENGADYVFWKHKLDYSPKLVMDHICVYFQYKLKVHLNDPVKVKRLSLEDEIKIRVNQIGFTDDMTGKKYVIDAVLIVAKSNNPDINLHKDVFPIIARKYNKSIGSVNRAIETAINKAWAINGAETLNEFYSAAVVSGSKGAPTNKEFVFTLAQEIKDVCKA